MFGKNKKVVLNSIDRMHLEEAIRILFATKGSKLSCANLYRMVYKCAGSEALQAVEEILK